MQILGSIHHLEMISRVQGVLTYFTCIGGL